MKVGVFVPAVMSVGLLFSIASLLEELFRWRSHRALRRRVQIEAVTVARSTIDPASDVEEEEEERVASRLSYLVWAITLLGGACWLAVAATANYLRPEGYVSDIAWLLAVSLALATSIGVLGGIIATAYLRWPAQVPGTRGILRRVPFLTGRKPDRPGQAMVRWIWITGAGAAIVTLLVGSSDTVSAQIDDPLADWFVARDEVAVLHHLDPMGRTEVAFVLAALVGVAALRCRLLAATFPVAVVIGGLTSLVLKEVIDRSRPETSSMVGDVDSFPSGHTIQAVLIAGLLPLGLAVITGRREVIRPATFVLGLGALGAAVERIQSGQHWPLDAVAGALIGLTIVLSAHWAVSQLDWHQRCRACAWTPGPHGLRHLRGAFVITSRTTRRLVLLGRVWSLAAVATLLVLLRTVGLPANPEGAGFGSAIEEIMQYCLLGAFSIGALIALRYVEAGATIMALAGTGLGTFAALQYPPSVALVVTATFVAPPFLLWLAWQRRRRWVSITTLATVTSVLLAASWAGATHIHGYYYGPSHPDSVAVDIPVDRIDWVWSGRLTSSSVTVVARLDGDAESARLVSTDEAGRITRSAAVSPDERGTVRLTVTGLAPDTSHTYVVEIDGTPDRGRGLGSFRTPTEGATSMRIAIGACARTGSNGAVFDQLAAQEPLLYMQLGDIHYRNIESASPDAFHAAFDTLLTRPGQAAFYRNVPVAYVWDDHDFGPNDADSTSPTTATVQSVYRQVVPHHELASEPIGPVHQAFTLGRVRFVITDTRSARTDETMLGPEQLAWFVDEIRTSSRTHALVIWASPTPWIGDASPGSDSWAGWADERRLVADAIASAGIDNLVMVSGDAHMVAIDDGSNSDYSTIGGGGFPVIHGGALDRPGSVKGGPYSEGAHPGGGQFGLLDIVDGGGDEISVLLRGVDWEGNELVSLERTFEVDLG